VTMQAVIFDWGGTLTPWHSIDLSDLWQAVCTRHFAAERAAEVAAAMHAAERELWQLAEREHRSSTMTHIFDRAGVVPDDALLASYSSAWEPHTHTDPDAAALLSYLRGRGIKVGVLSNTFWPRSWHEEIFRRDGVLDLIDGAVYSSELDWTKPHPAAFTAAMAAVGVSDPGACVFVGDRPFDDVHGAKSIGMRAVLIPNSDVPTFPGSTPDAIVSSLADLRPLLDSW
jgi:putative hydrolase of the HAD superfamily